MPWWKKCLGAGVVVGGLLFIYTVFFLPPVDQASQLAFSESTIIYDRFALKEGEDPNEHILYTIHGDENREYIPFEEIPEHVIQATIAIEDDGFYRHFGFDIGGIAKAGLNHFFGLGAKRGGSTITQQLVKNTFLTRERTLTRKVKEVLLSMKVEWHYTKEEILELYLNNIPYGSNAYGIEAAAKTFFGKSARALTISEAAILASLPVAPTRFSPYGANKDLLLGHYEYDEVEGTKTYKKGRKDLVLQRMLDLKNISFEQFKTAFEVSKSIEFRRYRSDINAPHFVFYVREKMEEKYGKEFLREGGLRIFTTLDPEIQAVAEEAIEARIPHYAETYGAGNAALASFDVDTGQLLAFVGGRDYFDTDNDGQVNVLTSRRQPGSSFKPLVYASAFEKGYSPATVVFDVETDFGGNYQPQNFDGQFVGPIALREALNRSLNIPAIKVAFLASPKRILELAGKLGIGFEGDAERHGVAIGIGVAEVEPLSHIASFQAFAGDGDYFEPVSILEVRDSEGKVLERYDPEKYRKKGLDPEVAALVRHILTDETTRPTTNDFDWNVLLQLGDLNNAAKTGTSNRQIENPEFNEEEPEDEEENPKLISAPGDSWTIGFTPHMVTGVWVGNNRGEPMKPGATGLTVAAPIWKAFMTGAHKILIEEREGDPDKLYNEPVLLETRKVNMFSGDLVTDHTPKRLVKEEVFASFSVPTEIDNSIEITEIDKISGQPATEFTPPYAKTLKYRLNLEAILPEMSNWKEPVDEWLLAHPKFLTTLGTVMDDPEDEIAVMPTYFSRNPSGEANVSTRMGRRGDDVHNRYTSQNPPQLSIVSPRNNSSVAPGFVEVQVSAKAKYELKGMEFYFDDQLVADASSFPWIGRVPIPESATVGSKHTIRAIAIDRLFNTGEAIIEVKIAADEVGPEITFLGPIGNQGLSQGSLVHVLADVIDRSSGVNVVEFFIDDQSLGFEKKRPFQKNFIAKGEIGKHSLTIKAWDYYGNVTEKSIPIRYERERLMSGGDPRIEKLIPYRNSVTVDIIFPNAANVEWAEFIVEQGENVIFSQKFDHPPKSIELQLQKNNEGKARMQLYSKIKGRKDIHKSPEKTLEL